MDMILWLNQFGQPPDFYTLAEEELAKAKEMYSVYFADKSFQ